MELKPGYEQTMVGVIPEDWQVKPLIELTTEIGDGIHATPEYVNLSEYFFINGNNLVAGSIAITENTKCVSEAEYSRLRQRLNHRTVLMSINGTIGNLAFFNNEKVVLGKSAAYINISKDTSREYVFYSLQSNATTEYFEDELTGTTIRNLSLKSIRHTPIPVPVTIEEQQAIAAALSDVDALISSLDHLIVKKRDIKQAAMQQLLTGKTRLPGFSKEWEQRTLGEIFIISAGESKSSYIKDGGQYLIVDMGAISTEGKLIATKQTDYSDDFLERSDLVMPKDDIGGGNIIGRVAFINQDDKYVLGDHVYLLKAKEGDPLFLAYAINGYETNISLRRKVSGSAQLGLNRRSVEEQEVAFPSLAEQQAIAAVLSDMDAEIAALEQKRDKTCALKQGMMQELLTGKTRLL
jgi:type I restriction enzyme S subunit